MSAPLPAYLEILRVETRKIFLNRSWLWLLLGGVLLPFAHVQTVLPLAPWIAPVFLIRFLRTQRIAVGLPALFVVYAIAAAISLRDGFIDPPPGALFMFAISAGYGLVLSLAYFIDRLLAPRLNGLPRTLVFPLALTSIDWLMTFGPFYTYGSPAYTQNGVLPLMQVVSLSGMWGLTFLIGWFGPTVNALWEAGFDLRAAWRRLAPFSITFLAVLLYGSLRLAFSAPSGPAVLAAAITPDRTLWSYQPVAEIAQGSDARRAELRAHTAPILDDLFARTRRYAQAGAKIVIWSETAAFVPQENTEDLFYQASALAREEGIYLQMGLMVIRRAQQHPYSQNRAVLFDPRGELVWDYEKALPVLIGDAAEIAPGPGILPVLHTPFGTFSGLICQDADLPALVRQAGQARASLLFDPADDWAGIMYDHSRMATFRAIENGVSLLRPSSKGLLTAVDYLGRPLAQADFFASQRAGILAAIPTHGVFTLYPIIGDLFAYASAAGLASLAALAIFRRRPVKALEAQQV
jgi:apolipoprotein N-acyltransferase